MSRSKGLLVKGALLAISCLGLTAQPVLAGESPWYVEARFGQAEMETQFGARHPKWIDDESETAAIAIGYTLHRYLSVQAGYRGLGGQRGFGSPCRQTDDACIERLATLGLCVEGTECAEVVVGLDADLSGFTFAAVPRWPLSERFSLHGKVGLMAWDAELSDTTGGFGAFGLIEDFSGEDLLVGVGLRYEFREGLGVSLEYDELDLEVSSTVVGVSWRF